MSDSTAFIMKSKTLSKDGEDRFIIIDRETGEILEDANGQGYKSMKTARHGWRIHLEERRAKIKLEKEQEGNGYSGCRESEDEKD